MIASAPRALINWRLISDATEFYADRQFQLIETPWRVAVSVALETMPPFGRAFTCSSESSGFQVLVGSAEQGFLQISDSLVPGKCYQSVSPCFRDERELSDIKFRDFVKVELISVAPSDPESEARRLASVARSFLKSVGVDVKLQETDIGWDLTLNGIEVGSYGFRTASLPAGKFTWAYGTGCAEPRLSQAIAMI